MRKDVFESNLAFINAHNNMNLSWTAGINQFTDRTESEMQGV
jgi:hypothetical protein